ncbi:hypothetical protein SAMN04515695_1362 [Pseudovibrio sp. Tun.PSC04-5.I4]|nr:hypothetical protein SAMN04515695_1362 [Pseudovibrio sp. Tun.PSC04-5.I4]
MYWDWKSPAAGLLCCNNENKKGSHQNLSIGLGMQQLNPMFATLRTERGFGSTVNTSVESGGASLLTTEAHRAGNWDD